MPRALHPYTSDAELAAHSNAVAQIDTHNVLTPQVEAFCQSGVSVIIALSAKDVDPVAGTGCGCRVMEGGRLRLLLRRSGNDVLLSAAERGARIAVTFSQPLTHRSIQIKGAEPSITAPTDDEKKAALSQLAVLCEELKAVDHAPRFCDAYCYADPDDLVAIDFCPEAAFAQTPGPGAGAELKR